MRLRKNEREHTPYIQLGKPVAAKRGRRIWRNALENLDQDFSFTEDGLQGLDRVAGDFNVLLAVLAIGLATLDMTCFVGQRLIDDLPEMTRVAYVAAPVEMSGTTPDAEPTR